MNGYAKNTYVPLQFAPGEAFQFDWSEDYVVIGGVNTKLQIAHFRLSHSRAFFLRAYLHQTHEMLFDAHFHAFQLFGGVPERGIYDNMKTAVDKVGRGKQRTINKRFQAMVSHYLFEAEFLYQYWQVEQEALMAVPAAFDGFVEFTKRVSSTCLITHDCNRYSVPASFANRPVSLRVYPDRIVVVAEAQIIASHARVFTRDHNATGKTIYDWRHYLSVVQRKPGALRNGAPFTELPNSFKQLQNQLLKRPGGDREMADVLALVLLHDEKLVEQAIEAALSIERPSRQHVMNCLNRLQDKAIPEPLNPPPASGTAQPACRSSSQSPGYPYRNGELSLGCQRRRCSIQFSFDPLHAEATGSGTNTRPAQGITARMVTSKRAPTQGDRGLRGSGGSV